MKKILYLLVLLVSVEAQAKITYSIGVKGGPAFGRFNNLADLGNKPQTGLGGQFSPRIGGGVGINGKVWFNKYVGLGLSAEFNMGGNIQKWQQRFPGNIFREDFLIHKFNYVTIPLVAHVGWGNERLKVFGTFGGYYAIPVTGTVIEKRYLNKSLVSENNQKADFKADYSRSDLGIRFGVGFEVYVSKDQKHGVSFDATYDFGFTRVYSEAIDNLSDDIKIRNSRTLIQVGYLYRFGLNGDKKSKGTKSKTSK